MELTSYSDSELVSNVNIIDTVGNDNKFEAISELISITEDAAILQLQKTSSQGLPIEKFKR